MDWNAAIERNRDALKRILASLVAMAGLAGATALTSPLCGLRGRSSDRASGSIVGREGRGDCEAIGVPGEIREASGGGDAQTDTPTRQSDDRRPPLKGEVKPELTLPRHLHRAVLRLLRPAEAAARRLIIVAARGLVVELLPPRPRKPKLVATEPLLRSLGIAVVVSPADLARAAAAARRAAAIHPARPRTFSLPLLDTLRLPRLVRRPRASGVPRILFPGFSTPFPVPVRRPPSPDDPIDTTRLALRLAALARALDDLPRHARRFARWQARIAAGAQNRKSGDAGRVRRTWPLRPGRPPGHRPANDRRSVHEVHDILDNTHGLALDVLRRPDTS